MAPRTAGARTAVCGSRQRQSDISTARNDRTSRSALPCNSESICNLPPPLAFIGPTLSLILLQQAECYYIYISLTPGPGGGRSKDSARVEGGV